MKLLAYPTLGHRVIGGPSACVRAVDYPQLVANAIERLLPALNAIRKVADSTMPIPETIRSAIERASARSEAFNGAGETHTLTHTTVNIGTVRGGVRTMWCSSP